MQLFADSTFPLALYSFLMLNFMFAQFSNALCCAMFLCVYVLRLFLICVHLNYVMLCIDCCFQCLCCAMCLWFLWLYNLCFDVSSFLICVVSVCSQFSVFCQLFFRFFIFHNFALSLYVFILFNISIFKNILLTRNGIIIDTHTHTHGLV